MDKLKKLFKHDKGESAQSSSPAKADSSASKPSNAAAAGSSSNDIAEGVVMHTSLGDITIALYRDQTPKVPC